MGIFKTGLLHIHLGGCELAVLIDSYKLYNSMLLYIIYYILYICYIYIYTYICYICIAHIFPIIQSDIGSSCIRSLEDTAVHQGQVSRN